MKQLLLRVLVAGASLAFFVAPGWADQAAVLTEVGAEGTGESVNTQTAPDETPEGAKAFSRVTNSGQGSSISASNADNSSFEVNQNAVNVYPTSEEIFLEVRESSQQEASAQALVNTVASVNAVQSNVTASDTGTADSTQANIAYSHSTATK